MKQTTDHKSSTAEKSCLKLWVLDNSKYMMWWWKFFGANTMEKGKEVHLEGPCTSV